MKNIFAILGAVALLAVSAGVPASAAPAHDNFAASIDGSALPPCPSMFKCRAN